MGKVKPDDKSSISGNFCKSDVAYRGENALSFISSLPQKRRSDDVKSPKNNLRKDTFVDFDPHLPREKRSGMPRTRENRTSNRSSVLRKKKNKVGENETEIVLTNAKETVISSTVAPRSKSRDIAKSKRLIDDELSQQFSDDRLSRMSIPGVHIERLNSTVSGLFATSNSCDNSKNTESKPLLTKTVETYISASQDCQLLDETSVKVEHGLVESVDDLQLGIKQEHDCNDDENRHRTQVTDTCQHRDERASPFLTKIDNEQLKSVTSKSRNEDSGIGEELMDDKLSNNTAESDESCTDVVVLSVDNSRSKATRRPRNDTSRKRSTTDDVACSTSVYIKREPQPCPEKLVVNAYDEHMSIHDTPNKMARTNSKNVGAKAAKKTRTVKSKVPSSSVSPSILTRSMIKIPGLSTSSMFEVTMSAKKRRVTESEMWLNRRLEQQACLLWSSEQKRRFQQQYPDSPSDVIDDAMRRHWESLGDRDRHRYVQRARSAMAVERGRQLGRRDVRTQLACTDETESLSRRLEQCTTEQLTSLFDAASADQQSEMIRHKLKALQRHLAAEDYADVAHLFRDNLRLATDHPTSSISHHSTTQPSSDACRGKMECLARRVMFSTVLQVESCLRQITSRRDAYLTHQTLLHYHVLLSRLIHHNVDVEMCHGHPADNEGCFSARLDQLLTDLADIDTAVGECPGWSDTDRDSVVAIAAELSLGWFAGSTTLCVAGQHTVVPNITDLCSQKLLLYDASVSPCVAQLSAFDVDQQLTSNQTVEETPATWAVPDIILAETAGHVYRLVHGLERCCSLDSPSCVLTDLIIYDRLCRLHQHGGRSVGGPSSSDTLQTSSGESRTIIKDETRVKCERQNHVDTRRPSSVV